MKKRIVSLILAVLVVAGLMATAVFAAGDAPAETPVTINVGGTDVSVYHRDRVEPTCTTTGTIEYWKAVDDPTCYGKRINEQTQEEEYYVLKDWNKEVVLKALGHDKEHHEAVASTCKDQGTIEYWHCKRCGKNFSDEACTKEVTDVKAPLAAHTLEKTEAKAATCTEKGNNAYWTCSVCKKVFSDAEGKNETTVEKQTIPALDHDYTGAKITYTWTGVTACKAERTCTRKGCGHVDTVNATITSAVTTAATCEKPGVRTYTATFTGAPFVNQTKTETIAATGHNWKQTWVWSDADRYNNRTASLTLDCQNAGCPKSVKLTARVTYKVTREPTATRKGTCEWTATATYNNVTYTDTQVGELDKNGKLDYSYYYVLYFETNGGSAIQTYFSDYYNVVDLTKYNPTRRGYTFDGWYSDVTLRTRVTSVTLRANKPVVVYAGWTKGETTHNANTCAACAFRDVSVNDWFHDYVRFVVDNQMMQGTYTSWFEPKEDMTREQLVRAMYRVAGEPYVRVNGVFKDVKSTDSFAKAVEWAANYGIVNGVGNGKFDPYSPVTREQMAAIFYRFANYVEKYGYTTYRTVGFDWNYSTKLTFKDADKVSSWAKDAVAWCVKNGILYGDARNNVNPQYSTTRAEGAAILTRFCK